MSKRIMGSVIYISLAGFEPDLNSNGYYLDEQQPVFELVCLQQKGNLQQPFQPPGMDLTWSAVFTPDGNSIFDLGYEAHIRRDRYLRELGYEARTPAGWCPLIRSRNYSAKFVTCPLQASCSQTLLIVMSVGPTCGPLFSFTPIDN